MLCVTCRRMAGLRLPNQIAAELKKKHRRRRDGLKSCTQKKWFLWFFIIVLSSFLFAKAMSSSYRHHHQHHLGVILTHFTLFSVLVPHRKKTDMKHSRPFFFFLQLNFSIELQARIFFREFYAAILLAGWEFCVNQHSKARHIFMPFYRPVTRVTFIFMRSMVRWRWRRWPARSAAAAALCDSQKRADFFFRLRKFHFNPLSLKLFALCASIQHPKAHADVINWLLEMLLLNTVSQTRWWTLFSPLTTVARERTAVAAHEISQMDIN